MTDDVTLWGLLEARVALTPDALLFVDEAGHRMTFAHYRDAAARTAAGLAGLGIGAGTVMSWILPTTIDTFVVMAALSRLSVVQNPIVPIYREREIGHIVDEAGVDVLLVTPRWRGVDYAGLARSIAAGRDGRPEVLVLDGPLPEGDPSGLPPPPAPLRPDGAAPVRWLFYTSGSTGRPKGARHTDAGLAAVARGMADHLAMVPSDRSGLAFPAAHIGGPINLLAALHSGAAYILIEIFEPTRSVEVLRREGVTMAGSGTAFHLGYLEVQRRQPGQPVFPRLRCCPGGGAPKPPGLHADVKRELGGVGILSGWGLTEAPVLTMARPSDPDDTLATTEGPPLPGVELRVVSADGTDAVPGQVGELRVRAPQVMVGYVDPSLDADAFDERGFLRSGDLGTVDAAGFVTVTGRLKDVVIRNGENIAAAEVEELLRVHPGVADAVVIGLPDPKTGERVCAVLELRPGEEAPDVATLAAHLRAQGLRPQAWPERVEVLRSLPRTVAGKVNKAELTARYLPSDRADPPS
ncbi:MAG: class I adenylate-forming enzyme family protein [Acidimicrobiales bacterium]